MKKKAYKSGFTLIELLVVIGIIAILAALIFPAINGALKKGEKANAQAAVNSIEGALLLFFDEYRRWPSDRSNPSEGQDYQIEKVMVEILTGKSWTYSSDKWSQGNLTGSALAQNPKKIKFLDVPAESMAAPGTESDTHPGVSNPTTGAYVDPWNNMYKYMCDYDYNNFVNNEDSGVQRKSVLVWSRGADGNDTSDKGKLDDPRSWSEDH